MLFLLKPSNPDCGRRALERLTTMIIPGTKLGCRSNTMVDIQANGCLTRDEEIIDQGIAAVTKAIETYGGLTLPIELAL
jgi:hypothetical protein